MWAALVCQEGSALKVGLLFGSWKEEGFGVQLDTVH
jgi:hypothetical protein